MTMPPVVDRSFLLAKAIATCPPERRRELMAKSAKQVVKESDARILRVLEEGIGFFSRATGAEERKSFEQVTLIEDFDLLMLPNFHDLRFPEMPGVEPLFLKAEMDAGMLMAEVQMQAQAQITEQAEIATELGTQPDPLMLEPPPMPTSREMPWLFWPEILSYREVVRKRVLRWFRDAMKVQARRDLAEFMGAAGQMGTPQPALPAPPEMGLGY